MASDLHPSQGVILHVEELSFAKNFGSQAEIEAASFGTAPVSTETSGRSKSRPFSPAFSELVPALPWSFEHVRRCMVRYGQPRRTSSATMPSIESRICGLCATDARKEQAMKLLVKTILLLIILAVTTAPVWGQVNTGTISGTVRDSSGSAVAGATVTARNVGTSAERSVTSGDNGQYTIPGLLPGIYELTVTSTGFAKFTTRVEVTVASAVTVEPQLPVSNLTTTRRPRSSRRSSTRSRCRNCPA